MRVPVCLGAALVALGACVEVPEVFECDPSSTASNQCFGEAGPGGCEPTGRCSIADPTCPSQRRYADSAGDLAQTCTSDYTIRARLRSLGGAALDGVAVRLRDEENDPLQIDPIVTAGGGLVSFAIAGADLQTTPTALTVGGESGVLDHRAAPPLPLSWGHYDLRLISEDEQTQLGASDFALVDVIDCDGQPVAGARIEATGTVLYETATGFEAGTATTEMGRGLLVSPATTVEVTASQGGGELGTARGDLPSGGVLQLWIRSAGCES